MGGCGGSFTDSDTNHLHGTFIYFQRCISVPTDTFEKLYLASKRNKYLEPDSGIKATTPCRRFEAGSTGTHSDQASCSDIK